MRILRWLGIALVALVAALVAVLVGIGVVARFSDGPIGPFPGGPLRTGTFVSEPDVDWSLAHGSFGEIELQLVEPLGSRTTGVMVHEGQLYVPCDLGFMWRRFSGPTRWMLHLIWVFKRWHEDALRDGRVVLRIDGKRYERQAVRVTDPELLTTLRLQLENMAERSISGPLPDVQTDPVDIWFFRMDPRPAV